MSGSTCVACGASGVILDHDGRCAGCPLPVSVSAVNNAEIDAAVGRLVALGRRRDEQRERLAAQRAAETDVVVREAYALAERAGFDWYDTESSARHAFRHAAGEIVALRTVAQDLLRVFRRSMSAAEWAEWAGTSAHGADLKNDAVVAAVALLGEPAAYPTPDEARSLPARNEFERESGRRGGE